MRRLCSEANCEDMGARPLRRLITEKIEDMLSRSIISGELYDGSCAVVSADSERFFVTLTPKEQMAGK